MPENKIVFEAGISMTDINGLIDGYRQLGRIEPPMSNEKVIDMVFTLTGLESMSSHDLFVHIENLYKGTEATEAVKELMGKPDADPWQIAKEIEATNKGLLGNIWEGFTGTFKDIGTQLENRLQEMILGKDAAHLDGFLDKLIGLELIDAESKKAIQNMINTFPRSAPIIALVTVFALVKTYLAVNITATGGTLMKKLNSQHTPGVPDPGSVIRAAFLDEDLSGDVRRVMAENGLDKKDQDLMFISQYATLDPDTVRQLFLRGFIDEKQMVHRLRELGFTPERIKEATQLFDVLPPIQDIATMMAKEAFEPQQVAIMGLEQELPGEFVKYAGQHGYSKEWAAKYWIMHWQQPGLELMFQAFHRRLIDEKALKVFMKTIEIPPYLRDVMIGVAYMPLTRVDIRRMYEDGVLTIEQVYAAYLDHGYSPPNAELMTEWTIRYAEPNEKELSRAQITNLYIDGHLTREDAQTMLVKLGFPEHRASLLITYAEYKEIKDEIDEAVDNVKVYFQNNLITKDEARQRLNQLNVPQTRINILIERWNIKNITDTKLPSKTDLDKFYRKKIIDDSEYQIEMTRLGYSKKYIGWYLENLKETAENYVEKKP
jgi:hypothetical protein